MNEQECLSKMVAPGTRRPGKYREGVIQILVTSACDKACFNCTQASNIRRKPWFMTPKQFEQAVLSLRGYFGVVGLFGGNPAIHPYFSDLCDILRRHVPFNQRGIWCNNPLGNASIMRVTFDPTVSNLNVHLDQRAYDEFKRNWPECSPVGLHEDSRHSPPFVAMKDVIADEGKRWELISSCDINQHWSAMIGVFRGELRAWFCEVAGAQAILHQDEPDYPDTGLNLAKLDLFGTPNGKRWWQLPMSYFAEQVRKHCHECGIPLRGHGELAQAEEPYEEIGTQLHQATEQTSETHKAVYLPKRKGRQIEVVTELIQLGTPLGSVVRYLQNSKV